MKITDKDRLDFIEKWHFNIASGITFLHGIQFCLRPTDEPLLKQDFMTLGKSLREAIDNAIMTMREKKD